ncbi:hypothetical protein GCM10009827_113190 [Dactylosporangium maewongense]|uniref:Uncharacterized protein n=1 Tax=Dactylosporangium maewongense TaxID=634393 RepID=A0ABN2D9N6_9ACTN
MTVDPASHWLGPAWDVPENVLIAYATTGERHRMPLEEWATHGPGPRHGTRPRVAYDRRTGDELPLTVVPLRYRNDLESRSLIAAGRMPPPWPHAWRTEDWGEPPCELAGPRPLRPHGTVRRLALAGRWPELASTGWPVEAAPSLCDVLDSDLDVPVRGALVDRLARLDFAPAAGVIQRQLGRFVYVEPDLTAARRCLHALSTMTGTAFATLLTHAWFNGWPAPVPQWAAEEVEAANGYALGQVDAGGRWVSAWDIPGWDFGAGRPGSAGTLGRVSG